jgi:predicted nuclease with RNAse H fold
MSEATVGIDLAGSAKRTAVCRVDWQPGGLRVEFGEDCDDAALVRLLVDSAEAGLWVGIDCPLGWPIDFVSTVVAHSAHAPLPLPGEVIRRSDHKALNPLLYRMTDEVVWIETKSRPPLSVSANLLGVVALRCARLLGEVERKLGRDLDRTGLTGPIAEVYPAATLRRWQLSGLESYKRPESKRARQSILELLERALGLPFPDEVRDRCLASHDALDALIAAFAVRAAALGRTIRPAEGTETERAMIEGWIHLPQEDCQPRELLSS